MKISETIKLSLKIIKKYLVIHSIFKKRKEKKKGKKKDLNSIRFKHKLKKKNYSPTNNIFKLKFKILTHKKILQEQLSKCSKCQ